MANDTRFVPVQTPDGIRWVDREDPLVQPFVNPAAKIAVDRILDGTYQRDPNARTPPGIKTFVKMMGIFWLCVIGFFVWLFLLA
jgi:hypothetical protein